MAVHNHLRSGTQPPHSEHFKNLVEFGEEFKIPFRWRYKVVPNLDHSTEEMTKNAIPILLNGLDYAD